MNRYLFLHRIKLPVIILVVGVTALLAQWHILSWSRSWPLYLIALGLLQLAERAAWSRMQAEMPPPPGFPGGPYPNQGPDAGPNQAAYTGQRGGWNEPAGPSGSSSTALSVTPPDFGSHDADANDEGRK